MSRRGERRASSGSVAVIEVARPTAHVNAAVLLAEEGGVRHADEEASLEHSRDALDLHVQASPVRGACEPHPYPRAHACASLVSNVSFTSALASKELVLV